jgi:putative ATP-binding cassette transporter
MNKFSCTLSSLWLSALLFTVFLTVSPAISTNAVHAQSGQFSSTEIDQYIQQEMAKKAIPGLAITIVSGQEIVYTRGYGYASLNTKSPVTPQTIFDLASCSKSFTALATLILWNDGLIDLDKPLIYYIPEFRLADGDYSQITIRELLQQTSGLHGDVADPVLYHNGGNAFNELISAMSKAHLANPPGTVFEYANSNYALLGALVERVSGMQFENFVQERIFTPLGMNNSTCWPEVAAQRDRANGHQLLLGKVVPRNTPIYRSAVPAGWIMSSAEDMGRWLITNLNDGVIDEKQVIPAEIIETMHATGLTFMEDNKETGYGMGWFTGFTENNEPVLWHGGDTTNFLSEMIILPEKKLGIAMLVNSQVTKNAHEIATGVLGLVLGVQFELPQSPWWASWKSVDNISIYATILSLVLVMGLIPYMIWQTRVIKRVRQNNGNKSRGKKLKIWWMVLPMTPWMLIITVASIAYIAMQSLFGFNVFVTIWRFGYFAPPGTLVAAITMLIAIFMWAIALSITMIFRTLAKEQRKLAVLLKFW